MRFFVWRRPSVRFLPTGTRSHLLRILAYSAAVFFTAAALLGRVLFSSQVGPHVYVWFGPAVMLSAVLGGLGPGLLATGLSSLAIAYWVLPPPDSFILLRESDAAGLIAFVALSVFVSVFVAVFHRIRRRAARYEETLAVRDVEKRFRHTFENAAVGMTHTDASGRFILINSSLCDILGYSREELLQKTFSDVSHPDTADMDRQLYDRMMRGELEHYTLDKRLLRKDGRDVWVRLTRTAQHDPNRKTIYSINVYQDITDRKRAEESLRENVERLKLAQNAGRLGVFDLDMTTNKAIWTEELRTIFGVSPEVDSSYENWAKMVHPEDLPRAAVQLDRAVENNQPYLENEYRIIRPDGQIRWISNRGNIFYNPDGKPIRMIGTSVDVTEAKRSQELLQRRETIMKQAEHLANLGAWEIDMIQQEDINKNPLYWSDHVYHLFGYEPGSVKPTNDLFFQHVHPEDRAKVTEAVRKAIAEKQPYSIEHRIIQKDGTERIVHERAEITFDATGRPLRILGTVQDITERKQTEAALQESEEKYRTLVERANDGIIIVQDGIIVYANPRMAQQDGSTVEEVIGTHYTDHVYPSEIPRLADIYQRRMAGEDVLKTYETTLLRRDGSPAAAELNAGVINYHGKPADMVIVRDISARKQAEDALRESKNRLSLVFESVSDILFDLSVEPDEQFRFSSVNSAFLQATGLTEQQVVGKLVQEVIPEPSRSLVLEKYREAIHTAKTTRWEETSVYPTGTKYGDVSVTPIFDKNGRCTHLIGAVHDITERKQAEAAIRTSEERHRSTLDALTDGAQIIGFDWRYIYLNDAVAVQGKRPKAELIGHTMMEAYPGIENTEMFKALRFSMERRERQHVENEFIFPDGTSGWFDLSIEPIKEGIFILSHDITERRRVEKELEESENKYHTLFESGSSGYLLMERAFFDCNEQMCHLWACSREDILGKTPFDFSPPIQPDGRNSAEAAEERISAALAGQPQQFYWLHKRKDGSLMDAEIALKALTIGGRRALLATVVDITERKQAEEGLANTLRDNELLSVSATRFLEPMNMNELFHYIVQQFQAAIGSSASITLSEYDKVAGTVTVRAVAAPENKMAKVRTLIGRDPTGMQFRFTAEPEERMLPGKLARVDGGLFELSFRQLPLPLCQQIEKELNFGDIYGMAFSITDNFTGRIAVYTDKTEGLKNPNVIEAIINQVALALKRQKLEDALKRSETRFRATFDRAGIGMMTVDVNGNVMESNSAFSQFVGYSKADLTGMSVRRFAYAEDLAHGDELLREMVEGKRDSYQVEKRYVTADGSVKWGRLTASIARNPAPEPPFIIGMIEDINERKQAEADRERLLRQIDEERSRWRGVVESIADEVWVCDSTGKAELVNFPAVTPLDLPSFKNKTPDEIMSEMQILTPDGRVRPHEQSPLMRSLRGETVRGEEIMLHRETGRLRYRQYSSAPLRDKDGAISGAVAVLRDVTQFKEAQEEIQRLNIDLQHSVAQLRTLLEVIPIGIGIAEDTECKRIQGNKTFANLLGVQAGDNLSLTAHEGERPKNFRVLHQGVERRPEELPLQIAAARGELVENYEADVVRDDGVTINLLEFAAPLRDPEGKTYGAVGAFLDITKRKQMEDALRESERRLLVAQEAGHVGSFDWDLVSGTGSWSDEMCAIHGIQPNAFDAKRTTWFKLVHKDDFPPMLKDIVQKVRSQAREIQQTYRIVRPDGEFRWVTSQAIVTYKSGKATRLIGTCVDITERKAAQEAMSSSLRQKEVMLREIHHRVKNNLQVIISLLRLQSDQIKDPRLGGAFLSSQNRVRSIAMVHEKLYKSPDVAVIDLASYLESLVGQVARTYEVSAKVRIRIDAEPVDVEIDTAVPCALIANELVANALAHAFPGGRGGEVVVTLRSEKPDMVTLAVRDNGVGLPDDFDMERTQTLGLRLVTALSEQIRGRLEIIRTRRTEFRVVFPNPIVAKTK